MKNINDKHTDGTSIEGHSEPIVSKEMWEEVKKKNARQGRRNPSETQQRVSNLLKKNN